MTIKDVLKKDFGDNDKIILKRFKSAKFIFIIMSLLFFVDYFLLSHFPKNNLFILLLPILYVAFITSIMLITYYSLKIKFKEKINMILSTIILLMLTTIGIILSLPFLLKF